MPLTSFSAFSSGGRGKVVKGLAESSGSGDDLPSVFSGSLFTGGQGVAEVLATGVRTEIGKIGKALQRVPRVIISSPGAFYPSDFDPWYCAGAHLATLSV